MRALLVASCTLVTAGFAQALMGQRGPAWIAFAATSASIVIVPFTVWAAVLVVLLLLATAIDAGLRYRRLQPQIRWSWLDPLLVFFAGIALQIVLRIFVVEAFKAPSSSMNPTLAIGDHFFINKLARSPSRGDIITFWMPCEPTREYVKRVVALAGDSIEIRCGVTYLNGTAVPRELLVREDHYEDFLEDYSLLDGHSQGGEWVSKDCSRYRETLDGHSFEIFHDAEAPARDDARKAGGYVEPDSKDFPSVAVPPSCPDHGEQAVDQAAGKVVATAEPTDPCKPHQHYVVPDDHVFVMGDNRPNSNDSRYWGSVPVHLIKGRATGIWWPLSRFGGVD